MRTYLEEGVEPGLGLVTRGDGLLGVLKEVDKWRVGLKQSLSLKINKDMWSEEKS